METKSMHTKLKKRTVLKALAVTNLLFTYILLLSPFFAIWSTWTICIKVCISALLGSSISKYLYRCIEIDLLEKDSEKTNFKKKLIEMQKSVKNERFEND